MCQGGSGDRGGWAVGSQGSHTVSWPTAASLAQDTESRGRAAKGSLGQAGGGDMSPKGHNRDAIKLVGWALRPHGPA